MIPYNAFRHSLLTRNLGRSAFERELHLAIRYHDCAPPPDSRLWWPRYLALSDLPPNCRYCHLPIDRAVVVMTGSYWWPTLDISHPACRIPGERHESLVCQTLDADCNDCRYFRRESGSGDVNHGECLKFHKPTHAYPNFATLHECFEHRRAGVPS